LPTDTPAAFFSYSRHDSEFTLKLAGDLKSAGANVWLDQLDIAPGQRWDRSVEDALNRCPRMLVVLSESSVDSTNVLDEVSFALERQKTVIPILYRDCVIPFRVRRIQYIDFRTDYAHGLKELLKTLGVEQSASIAPAASAVPKERPSDVSDVVEPRHAPEQPRLGSEERQAAEKIRLERDVREQRFASGSSLLSRLPGWTKVVLLGSGALIVALVFYLFRQSAGQQTGVVQKESTAASPAPTAEALPPPPPTSGEFTGMATRETATPLPISPSFSCKGPAPLTPVDVLICNDEELARLDVEMAQTYHQRLQVVEGPAKQQLIVDQRNWLKERSQCASSDDSKKCVEIAMRRRITELQSY
jgi:uncharacterized protein YecT (DUF1311 family)